MTTFAAYKNWRDKKLKSFRGGMIRYLEILSHIGSDNWRVLHFGCGRGLSGVPGFFPNADILIGLDLDREALEQYPAPAWHINSSSLPFADNTFDLVVSEFVLEHLEDPDEVFREVFRVLTPGGRFISVAPNRWSYKSIAAHWIPNRLHAFFVRMFRPDTRREEQDVYPTYFRANSAHALKDFARNQNVELVRLEYLNNGPTWFQNIPGLFELGLLAHNALELKALAGLRCNLVSEFRKTEGSERATRVFTCLDCGACLEGRFPTTNLICTSCDKVYKVHNGVYD